LKAIVVAQSPNFGHNLLTDCVKSMVFNLGSRPPEDSWTIFGGGASKYFM